MKKWLKIIILFGLVSMVVFSCSEENPLEPDKEVVTRYKTYISFADLVGTWQDAGFGGYYVINNDSYIDYYPTSYTLYAEIIDKQPKSDYFIIHITNHTAAWGAGQIGKYTKVHWKEYGSITVDKAEVSFSQHYPQADSLEEARLQTTAGMMWALFTNCSDE